MAPRLPLLAVSALALSGCMTVGPDFKAPPAPSAAPTYAMSGETPAPSVRLDPDARTAVFDIVERLVQEGLLQEEGNDFYSLTEKGKAAQDK